MMADLRVASTNLVHAIGGLVTRGERLEALSVNAAALDADTDAFRRTSLGVLDQRCAARYCRACFLDVDFRRFACTVVVGALLFCASILAHWYFFT